MLWVHIVTGIMRVCAEPLDLSKGKICSAWGDHANADPEGWVCKVLEAGGKGTVSRQRTDKGRGWEQRCLVHHREQMQFSWKGIGRGQSSRRTLRIRWLHVWEKPTGEKGGGQTFIPPRPGSYLTAPACQQPESWLVTVPDTPLAPASRCQTWEVDHDRGIGGALCLAFLHVCCRYCHLESLKSGVISEFALQYFPLLV